ncbi:hypothetical protein HMPREF0297_2125 [Corynebacterium jeikeium ATCC 43734]|nr:hypothetical protein HMPREF0297_2125 [Corynebacterium jeikeium ATCC 43734]
MIRSGVWVKVTFWGSVASGPVALSTPEMIDASVLSYFGEWYSVSSRENALESMTFALL